MATKAELEAKIALLEKKNKRIEDVVKEIMEEASEANSIDTSWITDMFKDAGLLQQVEVSLKVRFHRATLPDQDSIEEWVQSVFSDNNYRPCQSDDDYEILEASAKSV